VRPAEAGRAVGEGTRWIGESVDRGTRGGARRLALPRLARCPGEFCRYVRRAGGPLKRAAPWGEWGEVGAQGGVPGVFLSGYTVGCNAGRSGAFPGTIFFCCAVGRSGVGMESSWQ